MREKRIGTSDMESTPPVMHASACPVAIRPIAVVIAIFAEMHACGCGRRWRQKGRVDGGEA